MINKPETVSARVSIDEKQRFYKKCSRIGKKPTEVIAGLITRWLDEGV
jgi:hypothetical protein